jgi:murein L,D-transpeptidase YafK
MLFFLIFFLGGTPPLIKGKEHQTSRAIKDFWQERVKQYCQGRLNYPPDCVLLRVFKYEGEVEVWGKDKGQSVMELLLTLSVCAIDKQPGPKLYLGDEKTPEGFYYGYNGYSSYNWWMWMNLTEGLVNFPGQVGQGVCFKICLNYPNNLDQIRTKRLLPSVDPGSGICIHGNCVTQGCVSLSNRDFLTLFTLTLNHNHTIYGPMQVHIFPFKFNKVPEERRVFFAEQFAQKQSFTQADLLLFWENLECGYTVFNQHKLPLQIDTAVRIKKGWSSGVISAIKRFFSKKKEYDGVIDSYYSDDLSIVVKRFQKRNGLPETGLIGPLTFM